MYTIGINYCDGETDMLHVNSAGDAEKLLDALQKSMYEQSVFSLTSDPGMRMLINARMIRSVTQRRD